MCGPPVCLHVGGPEPQLPSLLGTILHVLPLLASVSPCPNLPLLGAHMHSDWGCLATHVSPGPLPHTSTSLTLATISLSSQLRCASPTAYVSQAPPHRHIICPTSVSFLSQNVALWYSSLSFQDGCDPNMSTMYVGTDGPHSHLPSHTSC